jgi:elongation factor 1-beta
MASNNQVDKSEGDTRGKAKIIRNLKAIENMELKSQHYFRPDDNYHNKDKSSQNRWLRRQIPNYDGICVVLDGEDGGSSLALIKGGVSRMRIVAVSHSGDASRLFRKTLSNNSPLRGIHIVGKNVSYVLQNLNGPCLSVIYLDYTGYWTGNKSRKTFPKRDVTMLFKKKLPLKQGCLLMITICDPCRAKRKLKVDETDAVKCVTKRAIENFYDTTSILRARYRSNQMKMSVMGFFVSRIFLKDPQELELLNAFLIDRSYIDGYTPSQFDVVAYKVCHNAPPKYLENAYRWYKHIKSFDVNERETFRGRRRSIKKCRRLLYKHRDRYLAVAITTKGVKHSIILDIKPRDTEADLNQIQSQVQSIQLDGVVWGDFSLLPFAYSLNKLRVDCIVADYKVSVDLLEERIMEFENLIQFVDIVSYFKVE